MSKSSPSPPDYAGAAQTQGEQSQQLAAGQNFANRPNVTTPWGSQTWSTGAGTDPATGKPITTWQSNIQLSPAQQQALDAQQQIDTGKSAAAQQLIGQATSATANPMDWGGMPARSGQVTAPNLTSREGLPEFNMPNRTYSAGDIGIGTVDPFNFGSVNRSLARSPGDYRDIAQEAVWERQKPALDARRSGVETQLANQGLARGTEAWNREMEAVNDAEDRARLAAISEGRVESSQLFGQDLAAGQFGNQAQAQEFGQGIQATGFNNAASAQQAGLNKDIASFENASSTAEFQQLMQRAQAGDSRAMQELQAQISAGGFNNVNRSGAIGETIQQRSQPLNELNALLTGSQVSMPQFPGGQYAGKGETTDLMGAMQNQYGAQLDASNAKNAGTNSALSSAASLAAMYMMFSDVRLKEDISTIGILSSGVRVVHYRYRGLVGRYVGVIAQEVAKIFPNAVHMSPSGYLMVDYSKVR